MEHASLLAVVGGCLENGEGGAMMVELVAVVMVVAVVVVLSSPLLSIPTLLRGKIGSCVGSEAGVVEWSARENVL